MPDCSGEPVVTTSCAFYILHARPRVQRAPGIPCALSIRAVDAKLGRTAPRERGGVCLDWAVLNFAPSRPWFVMAGRGDEALLRADVPAIHVLCWLSKDVDARPPKAGHDEGGGRCVKYG